MSVGDPDRPTPDIAGFADAQETKRQLLGSDVIFEMPAVETWPDGTMINPRTGGPYDPNVDPVSSHSEQVTVRCGVFFKAVNRGGAEHAALDSPVGLDEHTRIFAIAPIAARSQIEGAKVMIFHGERWQIQAIKDDEIVLGYRRLLIYAAAYG